MLRDTASIPLKQLETLERQAAVQLMKGYSPLRALISRHTRELLRRYHQAGKLSTPIATRQVEDRFVTLTPDEHRLRYNAQEFEVHGVLEIQRRQGVVVLSMARGEGLTAHARSAEYRIPARP